MLIHERGMYLQREDAGAGTAVVDPPETPAAETPPETEGTVETPEATGEGTEANAVAAGATGTPAPKKAGPPETVPYAVFRSKLKERDEQLTALRDRLEQVVGTVESLRPAEKDALDAYLETLPDGPEGSDQAEFKANVSALAPILKAVRDKLTPEMPQIKGVLAGILQTLDRLQFENEQLISTLMETGEDGTVKDRRPLGLKHMERIQKHRAETFEKSGRRQVLRHRDAFQALQDQLKEEESSAGKSSEKLRQEGEKRAEQDAERRRLAAGGPTNTGTAPRTPRSIRPRTTQEIDNIIASGGDVRIA